MMILTLSLLIRVMKVPQSTLYRPPRWRIPLNGRRRGRVPRRAASPSAMCCPPRRADQSHEVPPFKLDHWLAPTIGGPPIRFNLARHRPC